jgi:uncharacterized protein (TIGR03032 family)
MADVNAEPAAAASEGKAGEDGKAAESEAQVPAAATAPVAGAAAAAPAGGTAAPAKAKEPWLDVSTSRRFVSWLTDQKASLAFTTYQAGKVIFLGVNNDGRISIFERTFMRSMGLWADGKGSRSLVLSSLYQIWRMEDALGEGEMHQGYDRLYIPRIGYTTGDLDVHDVAVESGGRIVFVNCQFGCLATVSPKRSFIPLWRPPFVSKLAPEDRCHMNGLALEDGKAAYVTCCSTSDVSDGWRDRRRDGGVVVDVRSNEIVCRGLSMPHSPRVHDGKLYVHNSGTGYFGYVDRQRGTFEPIAFCPGYLRGLAFIGGCAIVGLSKPRDRTFTGLPLDDELKKRDADPQCGLQVIDLKNGDIIQWARVEGMVSELYDVTALPGVRRPMALGFKTDEIQRTFSIDEPGTL